MSKRTRWIVGVLVLVAVILFAGRRYVRVVVDVVRQEYLRACAQHPCRSDHIGFPVHW